MLHKTLKVLRLKKRLTQQQMAKLLNIDRSTYTYYETGKTKPDVDTLIKICCIFNITLDSLVENRTENGETVLNADDNTITNQESDSAFTSQDSQEKKAIRLFRLCRDKDEAISRLRDLAIGFDSEENSDEKE